MVEQQWQRHTLFMCRETRPVYVYVYRGLSQIVVQQWHLDLAHMFKIQCDCAYITV